MSWEGDVLWKYDGCWSGKGNIIIFQYIHVGILKNKEKLKQKW